MSNDKTTLADVQPGGRVRLGDQAHVTISDDLLSSMAYAIPGAVETTEKAKAVAARVVEIYLSAQPSPGETLPPEMRLGSPDYLDYLDTEPSPGGQDALSMIGANLRSIVRLCRPEDYSISRLDAANIHMEAHHALQLLESSLAARQPVGEPVIVLRGVDEYGPMLDWQTHWVEFQVGTKFYTAPPAQDVDQGLQLDRYDAGLLGDGGGGDVNWWQDYIRAELDRAHEFYQDQADSQAVAK